MTAEVMCPEVWRDVVVLRVKEMLDQFMHEQLETFGNVVNGQQPVREQSPLLEHWRAP